MGEYGVYYGSEPCWSVVAKKRGAIDVRSMQRYFGSAASKDEILDRCIVRLRDPIFRQHWHGWIFCPVLVDEQVEITDNGALKILRRRKDEAETILVVGG